MIDTHTHIYTEEFDNDRDDVILRAKSVGVKHLVLPNIDLSTLERIYATEKKYAPYCSVAMGLHPTSVTENYLSDLDVLKQEFIKRKFCAVGEVGIDLYWDTTTKFWQQKAFALQVEWALEYELPLIIHSRNACDETLEVLRNYKSEKLKGVFHCFDGTLKHAQQVVELGFLIGVNGVVSFKNSQLPNLLNNIPLDFILLETDAPYLAPHPYRGKRNEPSFLLTIVEKIASIYGCDSKIVKEKTTENAQNLFRLFLSD
jgi:TatD DNase family protein